MYQHKKRNIHDEIAYANRVENAIIDVKQDKTSLSLSEQYITDRLKVFRLNFIQNITCLKSFTVAFAVTFLWWHMSRSSSLKIKILIV